MAHYFSIPTKKTNPITYLRSYGITFISLGATWLTVALSTTTMADLGKIETVSHQFAPQTPSYECAAACWNAEDLMQWATDERGAIAQDLKTPSPSGHYLLSFWAAQKEEAPFEEQSALDIGVNGKVVARVTPLGRQLQRYEVHIVAPDGSDGSATTPPPRLSFKATGKMLSSGTRLSAVKVEPLG